METAQSEIEAEETYHLPPEALPRRIKKYSREKDQKVIDKGILSIKTAADHTPYVYHTIHGWCKKGMIGAFQPPGTGTKWHIPATKLVEFLKSFSCPISVELQYYADLYEYHYKPTGEPRTDHAGYSLPDIPPSIIQLRRKHGLTKNRHFTPEEIADAELVHPKLTPAEDTLYQEANVEDHYVRPTFPVPASKSYAPPNHILPPDHPDVTPVITPAPEPEPTKTLTKTPYKTREQVATDLAKSQAKKKITKKQQRERYHTQRPFNMSRSDWFKLCNERNKDKPMSPAARAAYEQFLRDQQGTLKEQESQQPQSLNPPTTHSP